MDWLLGRSVLLPTLVVLGLYCGYLAAVLHDQHDPYSFIHVGRAFINQSAASTQIRPRVGWLYEEFGYDGQFAYYIALDPVKAREYLDTPVYRYPRILYPLTVRIASLGQPGLVPWALVLVNLASVVGGTLVLARWLRNRDQPPLAALAFGLYPGIFNAFRYDLNEPLSYGLAALGVLLLSRSRARAHIFAGLAFAAAGLAKEQSLLFPAAFALGAFVSDRTARISKGQALSMGAIALLPWIGWRLFLSLWLGAFGEPLRNLFEPFPFLGYYHWMRLGLQPNQAIELPVIIVPALICAVAAGLALVRRPGIPEAWAVLFYVGFFVIFLSRNSYVDVVSGSRAAAGFALAALIAMPALREAGLGRAWFWLSAGLWLSPMPADLGVPTLLSGVHLLRG